MTLCIDRTLHLVDELAGLFNRRSMDIPDGLFDRKAQFRLNGVAFEEMMGRDPGDPLILMLTRGVAGYRFTAKALWHALDAARLDRGPFVVTTEGTRVTAEGVLRLTGTLRGAGEAFDTTFVVHLLLTPEHRVSIATVTMEDVPLARLKTARLQP